MQAIPLDIVLRRFGLWLVVCALSAGPSFALAASGANRAGMIAAVLTFVGLYTFATSLPWFGAFHRRPFVRATLYVGYGARVGLSLLGLLAVADERAMFVIFPDMLCGILSLATAGALLGTAFGGRDGLGVAHSFGGAFLTTCVQGAILNAVVFVVMAIAYGLQRAFRKPPPERVRGFEVVPIEPTSS